MNDNKHLQNTQYILDTEEIVGRAKIEATRSDLEKVYQALCEKGYNPIAQLVGYILTEDPTYITTHNNARNLIRRFDSDIILQSLVKYYLSA